MRTRLLLVGTFLMLNAGAMAQNPPRNQCNLPGCTLPNPVFCREINPTTGSSQNGSSCDQDIKIKYMDLLGIAEKNLTGFVPPDHLTDYGRCVEENADIKKEDDKKEDGRFFEFMGRQQSLFDQRMFVNRLSEPLPIQDGCIYLNQNQQNYACFVKNESEKLIKLGAVVGRLEIRYAHPATSPSPAKVCSGSCNDHSSDDGSQRIDYAQWGTAIQLSEKAIVTSCHELESLVYRDPSGNWRINPENDLMVDFNDRDDQFAPSYHVKDVIWIPDQNYDEGFDVALLEIEPYSDPNSDPNAPKHKFPAGIKWGLPADDGIPREIAVVGYPDFHHPVDPCSEAAFNPYKTQGDAKLVSLGCAFSPSSLPNCKERALKNDKKEDVLFNTLFHTATTTMGESGSILVARDPNPGAPDSKYPNSKYPSIIGIHVCCSYPQDSKKYSAPPSQLRCANVQRTKYNQAISVCGFLQNKSPNFLKALNKYNIKLPTSQCPNPTPTASNSR